MTSKLPNSITFTIIFEASALNRDEKIGGNVPSIKKLTRFGNKVHSYISKVALRQYLHTSLISKEKNNENKFWNKVGVFGEGSGEKKVIQFDLEKSNIFDNAELDTFGYMYTKASKTLTRKGCLGITKAISLEYWNGDMQFNANHDLVERAKKQGENLQPNPVNKEEQLSYFKVSFTIDSEKLGVDEWILEVDKKEKDNFYDEKNKTFKIKLYEEEIKNTSDTVQISEVEQNSTSNTKETNKKDSNNKKKEIVKKYYLLNDVTKDSENIYNIDNKGTLEVELLSDKIAKFVFKISDKQKEQRLKDLIHVIKNGLIYHVSGESWGIVPKFIISAGLDLPIPIFNSFVGLEEFDNEILENGYINKKDNKKLIYIYNSNNIVKGIDNKDTYSNWNAYLKDLGLSDEQSN